MSTKKNENIEIIIRMKRAAGVSSDIQLAEILGYSSTGTISQWKINNVPDSAISKISEKYEDSFDEIKYGKKYAPTTKDKHIDNVSCPESARDTVQGPAEVQPKIIYARRDTDRIIDGQATYLQGTLSLSNDEIELLVAYRKLPDKSKEAVLEHAVSRVIAIESRRNAGGGSNSADQKSA